MQPEAQPPEKRGFGGLGIDMEALGIELLGELDDFLGREAGRAERYFRPTS